MTDSIERAAQRIYLAHMFGMMMPNLSDVHVMYDDVNDTITATASSRLDGNKLDTRIYFCDITSDDTDYIFRLSSNPNCVIYIPPGRINLTSPVDSCSWGFRDCVVRVAFGQAMVGPAILTLWFGQTAFMHG